MTALMLIFALLGDQPSQQPVPWSMESNTSGNENTAVGLSSLNHNTTGVWNTAIGNNALWDNIDGNANVATRLG